MGTVIKELVTRGHELVGALKSNGVLNVAGLVRDLTSALDVQHERGNALEAKCAALAAELSVVEAIHNDAVFITDDHYEQCPPEVQKIIRSLAVMQIPAYKAYLAEVRAQGVEMFALMFAEEAIKDNNITTGWKARASRAASEYAEALRQGGAA